MIKWHGDEINRDLARSGKPAIRKAAHTLRRDIIMHFTRTGYLMGKRGGKLHAGPGVRRRIPSHANQPPAVQTGNLRRSITIEYDADRDGNIARVGPGREAPYGRFLEFGTRRMKPRPYLRPALKRMAGVIASLLAAR